MCQIFSSKDPEDSAAVTPEEEGGNAAVVVVRIIGKTARLGDGVIKALSLGVKLVDGNKSNNCFLITRTNLHISLLLQNVCG